MSASTPNCLGDFFSKHPFSDEARARLAALAANGATPAHIIKKYVTRTDGYKNGFLKAERIAGSRPGSPLYNEQAVQRIVSNLGKPSHGKYKLYWGMYKDAAVAFIKNELPALDRLLAEVRPPDGTLAVADMLKAICANASEYGVSPENITTFYEIWGVPRIENFEAMLPQWLKADETSAQKRQLARLLAETAELRALVEELRTTVHKQEEALAGDANEVPATLEQHRSLEQRVQNLAQQVSKLLGMSANDDTTKRIDERVAGLAEKVNRLLDKVKVPREEVSTKDLQKLANETKLGVATSLADVSAAITKKMREEVAAAASELEVRISTLTSELGKRREPTGIAGGGNSAGGGYRSPLVGPLSHTPASYKLTSELDFVNCWLHHLSQFHDIALTFEQALAYHRAFLGSHVVICERVFALSWIECLAWQPFAMHMAASPTWSSEEDWAQGAEHLFRRESGRPPHFLVLHNYEVGLPDCYLAPSLALWALRGESRGLSKLFLLPSRHDHIPSPLVLEHAVCFSNNEYITTRPLDLKDGVRLPPTPHRELPLGADPKVVAQWAKPNAPVAFDRASLQRASKCRLTPNLVASFERTAAFLGRYLAESFAISIAMHHQVIPWVQLTHGEAKATELSALLRTMSGGAG